MVQQKEIDSFIKIAQKDLDENRLSVSIKGLKKVLELDPDNPEAHYLIGIAYIKSEDFHLAEKYLEIIVSSEMSYLHIQQAYMLLGYVYTVLEMFHDAENAFTRVLDFNFNNDIALAALGHVYYKTGKFEEAVVFLKKAIKINSENYNARNSLAYVMCEMGEDLDDALEHAKIALKENPANYSYLDTEGWIYYKKGKEDLARDTLKKALEIDPDNEEIKEHLRDVLNIA
ncbi:MAG: tetratricopeptide repeat protein [Spirochaetes bacterium]|nr:tetratricopeptide repeat protein [Spirochaetota bacterium]